MRTENRKRKRLRRLAFMAILVQSLAGCSQTQHRLNADREAYCTIAERNHDPRWSESDISIDMDPRSRYFDPYNPDCSPMPQDDPASHRYMHCVDGKQGWKHWGRNGVRAQLTNPQWRVQLGEYAELTEQNEVKLDVDSAVRLAYVNSPLNQNALETLYLTSLDVTGERFRLDTQFFGGTGLAYRHQGNQTPGAIGFDPFLNRYVVTGPFNTPEINRLTVTNDLSASRRFATAGEVLVGFANSFAFEFTGNDVSLASSLANFSFIQPLLRGAGRDVALEQLTLSERRLLANLRAYSQFRQGFFTQIVIGELGVTGPQRFGPTTNLQSFSGFGGVNGYLGLLQQAQQIRNTEDNLRLQLRTLDRLEALYENELIDIVQVDQFRQNIELTRANLLDQTNGLQLTIDNYTTQVLGLPSDLPIELDEDLVKQFQLIPTETVSLAEKLLELQQRIGNIGELFSLTARLEMLAEQIPGLAEQNFVDVDLALRQLKGIVDATGRQLLDLPSDLTGVEAVLEDTDVAKLVENFDLLPKDSTTFATGQGGRDKLAEQFAEASKRLDDFLDSMTEEDLAGRIDSNAEWFADILSLSRSVVLIQSAAGDLASEPERVLADAERLIEPARELFAVARGDLDRMEEIAPERERFMRDDEKARFRGDRVKLHERLSDLESGDSGLENTISDLNRLRDGHSIEQRTATIRGLTGWIQSYLQLVERLALVPAQARLEVVTVDDVELEPEAAFQIALENRLDFMNGRAALVDRWRAIQVAADALQSDLSITGSGDVRTATNNPVDFRASTSRLRLGVEFDAPLARLLERNGYREALIDYQRNRRNLIQSQDQLQLGLRALLRTLQQRKLQLEIQRRAVTIALRRVDQTELSLLTPPPQGQPGARPQINPTTAINLLAAQSSLQNSQNSFLAAWLNYYTARIRLYRELGVMQLDPTGKWIENSVEFESDDPSNATSDVLEPLPPPVPIEVFEFDAPAQQDLSQQDLTQQVREPVRSGPVAVSERGTEEASEFETKLHPFVRLAEKIAGFEKKQ
ncbi:TolC family protein [Novipirellula artificiosorum]|uniref:Outer membrane efflux protein n=1 Tax=Novipirellula artificiosorum TaxID=2528016 RepID=A0A5C6CX46_9BACT|nr:TolC family protein [Novipirellula artificiosorum]TWU28011.1 Outer membrane efflux protein [Novipirellula artificiosorum]